jgi:Na+(H+)/acetate symporter ActP
MNTPESKYIVGGLVGFGVITAALLGGLDPFVLIALGIVSSGVYALTAGIRSI